MAYLPFSKHVVLCALVYLVSYTEYLLGFSVQPVFPQMQREVTVNFDILSQVVCDLWPRAHMEEQRTTGEGLA